MEADPRLHKRVPAHCRFAYDAARVRRGIQGAGLDERVSPRPGKGRPPGGPASRRPSAQSLGPLSDRA
eukprot:9648262-Lingulodinium_polyedra.AAC.1